MSKTPEDLFQIAARKKYRYASKAGLLNTEDLFDLDLKHERAASLDDVARRLSRELRERNEETFIEPKRDDVTALLERKLGVVKLVIAYRLQVAADREQAMIKQEQKRKLLDILGEKADEELKSMSKEEIEAQLANL